MDTSRSIHHEIISLKGTRGVTLPGGSAPTRDAPQWGWRLGGGAQRPPWMLCSGDGDVGGCLRTHPGGSAVGLGACGGLGTRPGCSAVGLGCVGSSSHSGAGGRQSARCPPWVLHGGAGGVWGAGHRLWVLCSRAGGRRGARCPPRVLCSGVGASVVLSTCPGCSAVGLGCRELSTQWGWGHAGCSAPTLDALQWGRGRVGCWAPAPPVWFCGPQHSHCPVASLGQGCPPGGHGHCQGTAPHLQGA